MSATYGFAPDQNSGSASSQPSNQGQQAMYNPLPTGGPPFSMKPGQFPFIPISNQGYDEPQPKTKRRTKGQAPRPKVLPEELNEDGPDSNANYENARADPTTLIAPQTLGFMPAGYWLSLNMSFGDLVTKFFQRKNNSNCRFPHKLFNALLLVENRPSMWPLIGVKWITNSVFKVDKYVFGRLLGISAFDGGLFHRQGNFPSHGFREIPPSEATKVLGMTVDPNEIDFDRVRLLQHVTSMFTKTSSEDFVNKLKWANT